MQRAGTNGAQAQATTFRLHVTTTLLHYPVSLWRRYLAWQMRCAMRTLLYSLDDRTLRDIGVRRGEIERLVRDIA